MDTVSRNIEAQINSSIALGYIWKFKLLALTKLLSNEGPNPFHAIGLFQYPLKISEIYGFWYFQVVWKDSSGMKWVKNTY